MNTREQLNDLDQITLIINTYFEGLHYGDHQKLDGIFHDDLVLKAPGLRLNKHEWLTKVKRRDIPAQQGANFDYRILSVDLGKDQASVKVYCPLLGRFYVDYLGLLKEEEGWKIVNKMYSDM